MTYSPLMTMSWDVPVRSSINISPLKKFRLTRSPLKSGFDASHPRCWTLGQDTHEWRCLEAGLAY